MPDRRKRIDRAERVYHGPPETKALEDFFRDEIHDLRDNVHAQFASIESEMVGRFARMEAAAEAPMTKVDDIHAKVIALTRAVAGDIAEDEPGLVGRVRDMESRQKLTQAIAWWVLGVLATACASLVVGLVVGSIKFAGK